MFLVVYLPKKWYNYYGDNMIKYNDNFKWNEFLQPYELAVEGFILKIEGIKKQYHMKKLILILLFVHFVDS